MILRNLGKSGLRVSLVGLGCNNFGQRMDLESSTQGHPQGARLRHHAVRHRRRLRRTRRLGDRARPGARRAPQGHRACLEIRHADGRRREERRLAPLHHGGRRGEPEAAQDRLDRPLSAAPARPAHPDRGNAARARRSRARRQGALHRPFEFHAPRRRSRRNGRRGISISTPSSRRRTNTSLLKRDLDAETLGVYERYGLGLLPFYPLASGLLTGKHKRGAAAAGHAARDCRRSPAS